MRYTHYLTGRPKGIPAVFQKRTLMHFYVRLGFLKVRRPLHGYEYFSLIKKIFGDLKLI